MTDEGVLIRQLQGVKATDYGPYTTGPFAIGANTTLSMDITIDPVALAAALPNRIIVGNLEGTTGGGGYDAVTWASQTAISVAGKLRIWFRNNSATPITAINFTFVVRVLA